MWRTRYGGNVVTLVTIFFFYLLILLLYRSPCHFRGLVWAPRPQQHRLHQKHQVSVWCSVLLPFVIEKLSTRSSTLFVCLWFQPFALIWINVAGLKGSTTGSASAPTILKVAPAAILPAFRSVLGDVVESVGRRQFIRLVDFFNVLELSQSRINALIDTIILYNINLMDTTASAFRILPGLYPPTLISSTIVSTLHFTSFHPVRYHPISYHYISTHPIQSHPISLNFAVHGQVKTRSLFRLLSSSSTRWTRMEQATCLCWCVCIVWWSV